MSTTMVSKTEEKNKRIGTAVSAVCHLALLLLLFMSVLKYPDPPPGQLGVLVSFGDSPDVGEGEEQPTAATAPLEAAEPTEEETKPEPAEPVKEVKPEKPKTEKTKPVDNKKVLEDKRSKELALQRQKDKEKKERDQRAKDKIKEAQEAEERAAQKRIDDARKEKARIAKAKADAERRAREAKEAEAAKLKDGIGKLFGDSKSKSQGDSGTPGDGGNPDGDPDGKALDGISTGTGEVGGGLSGRNVASKPTITDRSQKTGDVNVKICVDKNGKVISAKKTLKGSTTNDPTLVKKAEAAAKQWRFNKSSLDKQCGTVLIKFRFGR